MHFPGFVEWLSGLVSPWRRTHTPTTLGNGFVALANCHKNSQMWLNKTSANVCVCACVCMCLGNRSLPFPTRTCNNQPPSGRTRTGVIIVYCVNSVSAHRSDWIQRDLRTFNTWRPYCRQTQWVLLESTKSAIVSNGLNIKSENLSLVNPFDLKFCTAKYFPSSETMFGDGP